MDLLPGLGLLAVCLAAAGWDYWKDRARSPMSAHHEAKTALARAVAGRRANGSTSGAAKGDGTSRPVPSPKNDNGRSAR